MSSRCRKCPRAGRRERTGRGTRGHRTSRVFSGCGGGDCTAKMNFDDVRALFNLLIFFFISRPPPPGHESSSRPFRLINPTAAVAVTPALGLPHYAADLLDLKPAAPVPWRSLFPSHVPYFRNCRILGPSVSTRSVGLRDGRHWPENAADENDRPNGAQKWRTLFGPWVNCRVSPD